MKKLNSAAITLYLIIIAVEMSAQTPQAIWTEANKTLTFYYGNLYNVGEKFNNQIITQIWSGDHYKDIKVGSTYLTTPGWVTSPSYVDMTKKVFSYSGFAENIETVVFDKTFSNFRPTSARYLLAGCSNLTSVVGIENLNTEQTDDMQGMFADCSSLKELDVSGFDTKNVTDMCYMFYNCPMIEELDVSGFNTQKVTDMSAMFYKCETLPELDVSNFDTRNVTDLKCMFYNCLNIPFLDVAKWNTSKVTSMNRLFNNCSALEKVDVSNFNTANVTDMKQMFDGCFLLKTIDVSNFNTANVTDNGFYAMFSCCAKVETLDVSNFKTDKATSISMMFNGCQSLKNLDVSNFNTSKVTNMSWAFSGCNNLIKLYIDNFDVTKLEDCSFMFSACQNLQTIYCSNDWQALSKKNCYGSDMFFSSPKLKGAVEYDGSKIGLAMANPKTGYFYCDKIELQNFAFDYGKTWANGNLNPQEYRFDEPQQGSFSYFINGNDVTNTISNAGKYNVTIKFVSNDGKIDYSQDFEITINPIEPTLYANKTELYFGENIGNDFYAYVDKEFEGSFTYKIDNKDVTGDYPFPGKYSVEANYTPSDRNSNPTTKTFDIEVKKGVLTLQTEVEKSKIYDRTTNAKIIGKPQILNQVPNSDIKVSAVANYDNHHVGSNKIITINYSLSGKYLDYYESVATSETVYDCEILPIKITADCQLSLTGICVGSQAEISVTNIKPIEPTNYTLTFSDNGFQSINNAIFDSENITFFIPEDTQKGDYQAFLTLTNDDYEAESDVITLNFTVEQKGLKTKWDDVVYVPNPDNEFIEYQWIKNDEEIFGATKQFFSEIGGLDGSYTAIVTTKNGDKFRFCPLEITKIEVENAPKVNVYPNPAHPGQTITIQLENINSDCEIVIFNSTGLFVKKIEHVENQTQTSLSKGEYIGVAKFNNENLSFKIIVKN